MIVDKFIARFSDNKKIAIQYQDKSYTYQQLHDDICCYTAMLENRKIIPGSIVELSADYSPQGIAMLLALLKNCCIVMPLVTKVEEKRKEYCKISEVEYSIIMNDNIVDIDQCEKKSKLDLYQRLRDINCPGIVILSSGTTGKSKAIVHNAKYLLGKFEKPGKRLRIISFLLFDHIGGLNTLFYTLHNFGTLVIPNSRDALGVTTAITEYAVEALTTSPTFLNLWLLSGMLDNHDCSSLKVINYGSELMPEFVLKRLLQEFPDVRLSQAYGMSETGVLNVRSKSSDSLFIKIDGGGINYRVNDGMLEIQSESSMLGYLNAPSPYTADGWLKTGDMVEVDGDYIKILGRASDIINVGGEKVYPVEVENVLLELDEIEDASVVGEVNAILGNIVRAEVKVKEEINKQRLRTKITQHCKSQLMGFMVPQKIIFTHHPLHGDRFKKQRRTLK